MAGRKIAEVRSLPLPFLLRPTIRLPTKEAAMRRIRPLLWSIENRLRGFRFAPVKRCRVCGHTAYRPRHPEH